MASISVEIRGDTPEIIAKKFKFMFIKVKEGLATLGNESAEHMRNTIKSARESGRNSGTGKLENAIQVYISDSKDGRSVGIGSIAYLNVIAPYWQALNYGWFSGVVQSGKMIPGYFGEGVPPDKSMKGSGVGREAFHYSPYNAGMIKGHTYMMKVTSPMAPVHYIENVKAWLMTITRIRFENYTNLTKLE